MWLTELAIAVRSSAIPCGEPSNENRDAIADRYIYSIFQN
jgi:hypothetical protein